LTDFVGHMTLYRCEKCGKAYWYCFNPDLEVGRFPRKRRLCSKCDWEEQKETMKCIANFIRHLIRRRK